MCFTISLSSGSYSLALTDAPFDTHTQTHIRKKQTHKKTHIKTKTHKNHALTNTLKKEHTNTNKNRHTLTKHTQTH